MGVRNGSAVLVPRSTFNRCKAVYLARGIPMRIVATAIRTKSLLARFALNATSACLAAKRLISIGNGALGALRSREFSDILLIQTSALFSSVGRKAALNQCRGIDS